MSSTGPGPVLTRRRLRFELRRLREAAGLPLDHVAREMVWSVSKIVRIESGAVGVSVNDAKALLSLYDVRDAELAARLVDLAVESRRRAWWSRYREHAAPAYLEFIGLEADAVRIFHFHPYVIPGLLQTREYAWALTDSDPAEAGDAIQVEMRMERRTRLFDRSPPPEIFAVFDETVLSRRFGGVAVLRDQLAALLTLNRQPNVSLAILPANAQTHPGLSNGFVILEFEDPRDPPVVFYDRPGSTIAADAPAEVDAYRTTFQRLVEAGVRGPAAEELIRAALDRAS
jgi:transcriptional regulator with XRE-family HTH domain